MKEYGKFGERLGTYTMTSLPSAGNYEYILKNDELLLKLDQYGIITAQINPPAGEAAFKREERENRSPVCVFISENGKVYSNFDVLSSSRVKIDFAPEKVTYDLDFDHTNVVTDVFVAGEGKRFVLNVTLTNGSEEAKEYSLLSCFFPYLNELLMAPWDKNEWYTKSEYLKDKNAFLITKYSVEGKKEGRRYLLILSSEAFSAHELSYERLVTSTKDFRFLPETIGKETGNALYAFKQCASGISKIVLGPKESHRLSFVFSVFGDKEEVLASIEDEKKHFEKNAQEKELANLQKKYEALFNVRKVRTGQGDFDRFVNGFLPLEMYWVSSLDRGWPTGMRGIRDASNDYEGMLCYDEDMCKDVIENIFAKQRSDGWYPRQIPFGDSDKFDLREFVDGACFFTEYVYDYLAYTGDFSILAKEYPYYDKGTLESGLDHLKKGIDHLLEEDSLGVHGLVKMKGGDWLDCLNGAGKEGKGETVMVSCQLLLCLDYLCEILAKLGKKDQIGSYLKAKESLKKAINDSSWNGSFYNAVYTDGGRWLFSEKDEDGEKRVYVPTNAYAIISGVASGKEDSILKEIKELKTSEGYRLFSSPLGLSYMEGIGKMGTGDFQAYFAENGSVYNHGSQCFLIRALAKEGRYEEIYDVLGYALPFYKEKHDPSKICAAPYAVTNCYHLVPSFYGRAGFSFLTGSVAMLGRAVYSWVFGVNFTLDSLTLSPCFPKEYANSEIKTPFGGHEISIRYIGYGSHIKKAAIDQMSLKVSEDGRSVSIGKELLNEDKTILIEMKTINAPLKMAFSYY